MASETVLGENGTNIAVVLNHSACLGRSNPVAKQRKADNGSGKKTGGYEHRNHKSWRNAEALREIEAGATCLDAATILA